jgi:hypothetical protein
MSRWVRAALVLVLALAISGCDLLGPSSQPPAVTVDTISAAMDKSDMKSAHFTVVGNVAKDGARYPVQGDGVLQRFPTSALATNLTLLTYSAAGDIQLQQIQIGGKIYSKLGAGAWTSKPETSTISPLNPTGYAGEDTRAGQAVWHVRSSDATSSYDMWVRESDAYIVLISYLDSAGNSFNFIMNSYNKSPVVTAP